jgi:thioredoxin 1/putative thioredoxin
MSYLVCMSQIPMVSEQNFEQEVLRSELPVLVEFGAEWCGPCKTVAPELEALSQELQGKAKILQVDVDKSPRVAQAMRVQSVPTFVVFQGGRPVEAGQGAMKKAQLRALLEPFLPRAAGALTPKELAHFLDKKQITPVDTRPTEVFARAHIQGAVNFPLSEIEQHVAELQQLAAPPVLYCRTGKESQEKATKLAELGSPVAFLEGGVLSWEAEGYRLIRPD